MERSEAQAVCVEVKSYTVQRRSMCMQRGIEAGTEAQCLPESAEIGLGSGLYGWLREQGEGQSKGRGWQHCGEKYRGFVVHELGSSGCRRQGCGAGAV